MGIFCPCQLQTQDSLVGWSDAAKNSLQFHFGTLGLTICLQVETRKQTNLFSECWTEFFPDALSELSAMSEGVPCELKMCLLNNWAVLRAERSFGRDTMGSSWKPINVEYNWLPDEEGRPNTIWGHGWPGVGRGLNSWTAYSGYKLNKQPRANIFGQWWPPEQTL